MTHSHKHDGHDDHHHDDPDLAHHGHGPNHNHDDAEHLHSHVHGHSDKARREEMQILTSAFLDGFRVAEDKNSYLRLAKIPFQREGKDGLAMHLVDAAIVSNWQIGTASPAFATKELVYMALPASMMSARETMTLTYVSLTERDDVDISILLEDRLDPITEGHSHEH